MTKILIVEDEPLILFSMASDLREAGFTVIEAINADAALILLENDSEIALVCTDVRMPGSIDGLGLARRLEQERPHLPVVIVSGEITARHLPVVKRVRMTKPVDSGLLISTISKLLC